MIRVKRNTGIPGILGRVKIYINDQEVARMKEKQEIELELPGHEAKISVSQFEYHSNEVIVTDGQVVEITNSSWYYLSSAFTFIVLILINLFIPLSYRIIGYLFVLILSFALAYFKNGFDLKVISP